MSHYRFSPEEKAEQKEQIRFLHEQFYMNKPQPQITMEDAMRKPVKKVHAMRKPKINPIPMYNESKLAPPRATVTGKKAKAVEPKKDSAKSAIIDKAIALLTTAGKDGVKFSVLIEKIMTAHKDLPKNTIIGVLVSLNSDPRISKPSRGLYVLKGDK